MDFYNQILNNRIISCIIVRKIHWMYTNERYNFRS
nr:MAG TPA: hypothetical protein [Caudoviricetes sp.]DAR46133.1 MAG TPA: hypothetical protein [Caudoviricetes sp.]